MGVIASVLLMLAGLFAPHHHTLNTQALVNADVTVDPSVTPTVSPTDTPTVTPTPTDVTVTPTVTDTPTPTVGPTVSPTPTATVSPTVTPTVVPSVSPTPTQQGDGDKDDMLGLKANFHALWGLMNAAFHHEQNEDRFEQKHGRDRDDK